MILYGWLPKTNGQSQIGLDQYYYMNNKAFSFTPVLWYQGNSGWYAEVRYNYEAEKTLSVFMGKTFVNTSSFSYCISTMAGVVTGEFNGVALALNAELEYKKLFFSLQSEHTFSIENRNTNFIYCWSDVGYRPFDWLSTGFSIQQTSLCGAKFEKGFFIRAQWRNWGLPLYVFNPEKAGKYVVLGLNFTWEHKKKITALDNTK